jgi:hypothetical protein
VISILLNVSLSLQIKIMVIISADKSYADITTPTQSNALDGPTKEGALPCGVVAVVVGPAL